VRTALAVADPHEEGARKALLQRLGNAMAVMRDAPACSYSCCWLSYDGPHGLRWLWMTCGGTPPGIVGTPCGHWHHRNEVFIARG
jgi:hypothetical protein